MHGGLPDDEQQRIVEAFKQEHAAVRVLVTGDVASEGVNLHSQCHELIHFDIPWSLIRIEQRNGRIDRYGQKHPPRITSLLLVPEHERFSGDIRVLASLMTKEDEAHRALGDVASLMGQYDVKGEEDAIRAVLAGQKQLDDVVQSVDDVVAGDNLAGLFASLFDAPAAPAPQAVLETTSRSSGLYPDEVTFLDDALHAVFTDPAHRPGNDGVEWRTDPSFGTAELVPPADLAQRLDVLPQSYLADRRVTEHLVLATTKTRGMDRLAAALKDEKKTSWPDAHYLGPLHPVLEWAADRALAKLNRNEVFAVRGSVEHPTVLLIGTLTNRRGHVVAATWLTVGFPDPASPGFGLVTPHGSAGEALTALGWDSTRSNPGAVGDLDALQALIAPAVRRAGTQMDSLLGSARAEVAQRVADWSQHLELWDREADDAIQRLDLRVRRLSVQQEKELVTAMNPDRQLVRPLLVVVPESGGTR
jgi:hypothetical protein